MKTLKQIVKKAVIIFAIFLIVCGLLYTLFITGVSQTFFKDKANGSIIEVNGVKYGSELLGQKYTDEGHLWGRIVLPDVTTYTGDDGKTILYAGASNKTPASEEYEKEIKKRVEIIKKANPDAKEKAIPVELVTCSGSGLDPHISVAAAEYQIPRIAKANNVSEEEVRGLIKKYTNGKLFGILGEKTVNVLKVNLEIDGILTEEQNG